MAFTMISFPKEDKDVVPMAQELMGFVFRNIRPVDIEGFMLAWLRGLQVVKETNNKGEIIGIAVLAMGERWTYRDKAITIILWKVTDEEGFFKFLKSIATATGASRIVYEQELIRKNDEEEVWAVRDIIL